MCSKQAKSAYSRNSAFKNYSLVNGFLLAMSDQQTSAAEGYKFRIIVQTKIAQNEEQHQ